MSDWTDTRVESLKTMWAEGYSAAQAARALGGVTRCGVIGKVHRLGLPGREYGKRPARAAGPVQPRAPRIVMPPAPPPEEPTFLLEPGVFAADGQCKFPRGDTGGRDWQMCGHPAHKEGSSWCSFHQSIVFDRAGTQRSNKSAEAHSIDAASHRAAARMGMG